MHKIQAFEGVISDNAAVHVDAALFACVALDGCGRVDDVDFVGVGRHVDLVCGEDANNGEERTGWLPALRAATGVVVGDVRPEGHLDLVVRAMTVQLAASLVRVAFLDAGIDRWVD